MDPLTKIHWENTSIKLPQGFSVEDWEKLEQYYKAKIAEGYIQWEIDLTQITFFSSTMLGLLVGFNAIVITRSGTLRVIVTKNSHLAQLLKISRVDQIMTVVEQ